MNAKTITTAILGQTQANWPIAYGHLIRAKLRDVEGGIEVDTDHEGWAEHLRHFHNGQRIPRKARKPRPPPTPVPREQWPVWAKAVAKLAEPPDTGVGDTIERELGKAGAAWKATMKSLGLPCRCAERKAEFNIRFPYTNE